MHYVEWVADRVPVSSRSRVCLVNSIRKAGDSKMRYVCSAGVQSRGCADLGFDDGKVSNDCGFFLIESIGSISDD